MSRRIAHLDMDAFYASVELLRYPQLKGLPVVIGGGRRLAVEQPPATIALADFSRLRDYVGRGVITTATYAARQFGVGSAMGLMKAAKLCPDAILLPVDFDEYRRYSRLFKAEIVKMAPVMEDRGVDEVYIDLSELAAADDGGHAMAQRLQAAIFDATGLTCSIGVAPNKLLAKMASELNKPNGISIIHDHDLERVIWPLSCRKINGIGPKTGDKLHHFGIDTIAELGEIFTRLCQLVAADLQRKGYVGRTVGIKIRYDNFQSVTRDHSEDNYTADAKTIRRLAGQCLKRVALDRRLRLLGVRVGSLVKAGEALPAAVQGKAEVKMGMTLPLFGE